MYHEYIMNIHTSTRYGTEWWYYTIRIFNEC